MTLSQVISGVKAVASSPAVAKAAEAVKGRLERNLQALNDANSVTDAVGRGFGPGYEDGFARLTVYEVDTTTIGSRGATQFGANQGQLTQQYDGVPVLPITTTLDYIILQTVTEAYVDRMSPNYSFGASVLSTSGQDARQFVYSGCVIADQTTGDNASRLARAYDNALRASELVSGDRPRFVELTYRDQIRRGYLTSFSSSADANQRNKVNFTFSMFVFNIDL